MTDLAEFYRWRHVRTPCLTCNGAGVRYYANGATWRGGAGGSVMTLALCDVCWGSGDAANHFDDLRKAAREEKARITSRAAELLANRVGAGMEIMHPALRELATELDRLSRGRKPRPQWFHQTCETLAKLLRELAT